MPDIRPIIYDFDACGPPTLERPGWTSRPPAIHGWWFMAKNHEDWDITRPVGVQRIEDYTGVRYQAHIDVPGCGLHWVDVTVPALADYVWYGPLRVPHPPRAEGSF